MEKESLADCDEWLATNFVESNDTLPGNRTLCEEYFARFSEGFLGIGEDDTTTLTLLNQTEGIEDVTNVTDYTFPTEGEILTELFLPEVTSRAMLEEVEHEVTTSILNEVFLEKEIIPIAEYFPSEVTTQIYLDEIKKYVPAVTTQELVEEYNLLETTTVYSKSHNLSLNATLCQWYLPTVDQTTSALGNTGIALWVLGFVITFVLIVMFSKQLYFIRKTVHKSFRLHIAFINSIYVIMALMTSIGSGIPRAHAVCSAIKDIYMAIGIGHFVDLTIAMYGGENVMAWHIKDRSINVRVVIICKCFFCLPKCKTTKRSITILKWLVWQMKWSQTAYYLIKLIWKISLENSLGVVPPNISFLYIHFLNVASFLSGVMSLLILGSLVREDLQEKYNYTIKGKLVRFTILTTKLQRLLFEILEASDVFPCFPPLVSKRYYKNVLKDFIYLVEVLILGTITFFVYSKRGEFEHGNSNSVPQAMLEKENDLHEENGLDVESGVTTALTAQDNTESVC